MNSAFCTKAGQKSFRYKHLLSSSFQELSITRSLCPPEPWPAFTLLLTIYSQQFRHSGKVLERWLGFCHMLLTFFYVLMSATINVPICTNSPFKAIQAFAPGFLKTLLPSFHCSILKQFHISRCVTALPYFQIPKAILVFYCCHKHHRHYRLVLCQRPTGVSMG